MKNRWLILSYFANIDAMAPSHHIDDRIPSLCHKGVSIFLLTSPCGARYTNIAHRRIPSIAPSGIRYEVRHFLRRKTKKRFWFKFLEIVLLLPVYPFYLIEKIFIRLDSTWSWFITASIAAIILSLKNRPEIIYSTGGPVSTHIAAMTASRLLKVPHIAEFQDPLVHEYAAPGKCERYFMKAVERSVLKTADVSVFLTPQAASNASRRNPDSRKTSAIYAGAVPVRRAFPYQKGEKFTIAHFGSLGGSRNLAHFFTALVELFVDCPDLAGHFRLDLYGNTGRDVSAQIKLFPHRELLCLHGKVPRQNSIDSMFNADVLLLIQNTDDVSFESIPSKVYEYLQTGRPILALVYRNPDLQTILEEMGHIVVQADDPVSIKKGLETYITKWKRDQWQVSSPASPYTVDNAVAELLRLADSIVKG
jgi:hypothetical protein